MKVIYATLLVAGISGLTLCWEYFPATDLSWQTNLIRVGFYTPIILWAFWSYERGKRKNKSE